MPARRSHMVLMILSVWAGIGMPGWAQNEAERGSSEFWRGIHAFDLGAYHEASAAFDSVLAINPAWADVRYGAAAFWLGESWKRVGQDSLAHKALRTGARAMRSRNRFDVRLGDAYLRHLMADGDRLQEELPTAIDLYVNLLFNSDALLHDEELEILRPHLAQLALVLPAGVLNDAVRGDPLLDGEPWSLRPGAGPLLVAWWRSQDPVPATRSNERLEEHLRRVAFATRNYADRARPAAIDDRGEVHLRYGAPQQQIDVTFDDPVLTDIVFRPGVAVSLGDFPRSEFWVFGHIDRAAWFLFVEEQGSFRIGETIDLVPRNLRSGFGTSQRGRIKAGMAIAVLQNIFRQLAPLHPDFAIRYAEVDNYAMQMPEFAPGRLANRTGSSLAATPGGVTGGTQVDQPARFIQTMMLKSRSEDDASIARRQDLTPRVYTEALAELGGLALGYRAVRYLEPDGSTRTVVHWSPQPGEFRPGRAERRMLESMAYEESGQYLVTLTAVQKDGDYLDRVVNKDRVLITDLPDQNEAIPVQQTTLAGDTALFSVAMQWDQFAMSEGSSRPGPRIRVATARLDSLPPLNADPNQLEMSDLLPMTALAGSAAADFVPSPYPFATLSRDLQLGLSFEVYHLGFGDDDQTRYTVSFEVTRDAERGGFLSRRGREAGTSSSFSATGTSRKATEMILVDLQAWEGSGELDIEVTVTDDVTGRSVSRQIQFELR